MKKYVLIAGVNGVGKSTLYNLSSVLGNMPRVNTDEIVREFGHWKNTSDVVKAGKIAIRRIEKYFLEGVSFHQETTLCGKTIIKNIYRAKELEYYVELYYIGVDSVDIVKERVKKRVEKGGHGISEIDIERRYVESFKNLNYILSGCDLVSFYDNKEVLRRFAIYRKGIPIRISEDILE